MLVGLRALAGIAFVFACAMLVCAGLALGANDDDGLSVFGGLSLILLFFAISIRLAFAGRRAPLTRPLSFRILILAWLIAPALAMPPFLFLTDLNVHQAVFEAASAVTTTGATALLNLDQVSKPVLGWRAWLQWLGGLGTLMSIIVVLAPSGAGGTPLLRLGGDSRQIMQNRLRGVLAAYVGVTLACFALLLAASLPVFDAFALTLSTVSTGGMMPRSGSLSDYGVPLAEWVIGVFMLLGATSIMWHRIVTTGRLGRSVTLVESGSLAIIALALAVAYSIAFAYAAGSGTVLAPITALREGFVTAVSLVTTTGFEARNAGATALPLSLTLLIILIGGGMFSTAGGLKLYRLVLMARHSATELENIIYPHAVHTDQIGRFSYSAEAMRAVWTALVLFLLVWGVTALVLAWSGLPADASLVAALSAITNAGPVYQFGWAPSAFWPLYGEMTTLSTYVLSVAMVAGRLEVIGLVAGFSLLFFKR